MNINQIRRIQAQRIQAQRVQSQRIQAQRVQAMRIQAQRIQAQQIQAQRIQAMRIQALRIQAMRIQAQRIQAQRIQALRNKNTKKIDPKQLHRNKCLSRLPLIRKKTIKEFGDKTNHKETVCIEFRELPHIEFLIRNTILKLSDWNHTIVCGKNNYNMINRICDDIHTNTSSRIKIIKLDITNILPPEYSKLLMTTTFWNNFIGEKILIYQEDSMLFHNNIQPFLQYDYVGAPWTSKEVGNGGFSLRSKSIMKLCIEKNTNNSNLKLPEDVLFFYIMRDENLGKMCPYETAKTFSQENVMSINPLGGHAFWKAGNNLDNKW